MLATATTASAQVMVFAAHPDDEALMTSGVLQRAKQAGQSVTVVIATNGDCLVPTIGQTRQNESMSAMTTLGLSPNDVIFLGYPDCGLRALYTTFSSPTSQFTSAAGRTQTYGFTGLGNTDYHSYIYGSPALYNRPAMAMDVKAVLNNYRPQDIYVTSAYDDHPDHSTLNFFVVDALVALKRELATFQPTLHELIIHEPCELACGQPTHWPEPLFTPTQAFVEPPFLYTTPHVWNERESVVVPVAMQSTTASTNPKYLAISSFASQNLSWLPSFVKFDEVFWKTELWANLALKATATASSSAGPDNLPSEAIDGGVSGAPTRLDGEWVSDGQGAGAWLQLTWPAAQAITSIVLHDRPGSTQNITSGVLTFSDGTSVNVGALPTNGAGMSIPVAKSVTWVRFTVSTADGNAAGLAEVEVYGAPALKLPWTPLGPNSAPFISTGPVASPTAINDAATSALSVTATDPDGDSLTYMWTASTGTINGSGATATFVPPTVTTTTNVTIRVTVADGRGGLDSRTVVVTVTPSGGPTNVARVATATASSERVASGQTAAKAIDGVVDGYPTDPPREWSSNGELAGAWLQLTWATPQPLFRVVLHDRINPEDQVLGGTLRFSDGSTVAVGTLPNDGSGLTVDFPARTVTSVRFEVTSARGGSVGLAEIEAFADLNTNAAPKIVFGPVAVLSAILDNQKALVFVVARDPNGDPLSYAWQATGGTLSGTGAAVRFTPPTVSAPTTFRIDVQVSDNKGGSVVKSVNVLVVPSFTNAPPEILIGPVALGTSITDASSSLVLVAALDANFDRLTYKWQVGSVVLNTSAAVIKFTPPRVTAKTTFRVDVSASDNRGGTTVVKSVNITVSPSGKTGLGSVVTLTPVL